MADGIRCVNCFWFGYFRTEQARGGGTTYFHPETLPPALRDTILQNQQLLEHMTALRARDNRVACLRERTNGDGARHSIDPTYDQLNASDHADEIRQTSIRMRTCDSFGRFDPTLSFSDVQALSAKQTTDTIAERVARRRRRACYDQLATSFEQLANTTVLTPQGRGKDFESWFGALFAVDSLAHTLDVRNDCEQLDFTVWLGNIFAIGEVRWLADPLDTKQVRDFFGKLMDRPPFVIGIIVAVNGFTAPALEWISSHTQDRTILTFNGNLLLNAIASDVPIVLTVLRELNSRLNHPRTSPEIHFN